MQVVHAVDPYLLPAEHQKHLLSPRSLPPVAMRARHDAILPDVVQCPVVFPDRFLHHFPQHSGGKRCGHGLAIKLQTLPAPKSKRHRQRQYPAPEPGEKPILPSFHHIPISIEKQEEKRDTTKEQRKSIMRQCPFRTQVQPLVPENKRSHILAGFLAETQPHPAKNQQHARHRHHQQAFPVGR